MFSPCPSCAIIILSVQEKSLFLGQAPRERQAELRFRIGAIDWYVVVLGFFLILYLEYYTYFRAHGWAPELTNWPTGLTPTRIEPLLIFLLAVFLGGRVRFARLSRRRIGKFAELCQEMDWQESYPELVEILARNVKQFFRIYRDDYGLSAFRRRLASRVVPSFENFISRLDAPDDTNTHPQLTLYDRIPRQIARRLIRILPAHSKEQDIARDMVERVLMAPRFITGLSRVRPYLGIQIIRELPGKFDQQAFLSSYVNALMDNPASVFYWEIEKNQGMSHGYRYDVPESNHLLHFLLKDARVAHDLGVYKPIGDFALRELDRLRAGSVGDPYNQPVSAFMEREAWRSPVYATVRFFDIMVREALFQGIEWHMWLYYFPSIVERMVRNYRPSGPRVDLDETFPTPYNDLIYEAVSTIREWIKAAEEVPVGQCNVTLRSSQADHENGNIPKSSVLALGQCSRHVLMSERLDEDFKDSLMNGTFELYFELRLSERLTQYAEVLTSSLRFGGIALLNPDPAYLRNLHSSFARLRHEYGITHQPEHVSDLARAIGIPTRGDMQTGSRSNAQ